MLTVQQQDELMAQLQKGMAALEQENTLLRQTLADLSELEQRYRLLENRIRQFNADSLRSHCSDAWLIL
jgi:hypothetical protein